MYFSYQFVINGQLRSLFVANTDFNLCDSNNRIVIAWVAVAEILEIGAIIEITAYG
ncbi:MAG: hypothetical protein M3218_05085 [Thermoproteota archaeon]|nr:hypothetical protein [Thermoproteota archaeon]